MRAFSHILGTIAAVWVLALIQSSTHGNRFERAFHGDLRSCEQVHTALIQADHTPVKIKSAISSPSLSPSYVSTFDRIAPFLTSQKLVTKIDVVSPRKTYLLFPTGLSPPTSENS